MAEGTVRVADNPSGTKLVRTQELTVGANTVEQEVGTLADAAGQVFSSTYPGVLGKAALDVNLLATASGMLAVTGTLAAAAATVSASVGAAGNVTVSLHGTYVASVIFEASDDGGTTWYPVQASRSDGSGIDVTTPVLTNASQMWELVAPGISNVRVRCVTYTSGTVSVRLTPGPFLYDPSPVVQVAGQSWGSQGRTRLGLAGTMTTAANTEALLTLTPVSGGTAGGNVTSYVVPAGKTLRVQELSVMVQATAATLTAGRISLRSNGASAVAATSPVEAQVYLATPAAVINAAGTAVLTFPDGLEFAAGTNIGISQTTSAAAFAHASLTGFLY